MDKLKEWAKGKPVGLVIMAQQLAVGAEPCFRFLKWIKAGERIEGVSWVPNLKEWLRLYRSHRRVQKRLIGRFREFGGIAKEGADFAEWIFFGSRDFKKMMIKIKKEIEKMGVYERRRFNSEAKKKVNQLYSLHLSDIESDVIGKRDKELEGKMIGALKEPEVAFFFRVWIPCWLLYGEYPAKMMRSARLGDIKWMEKVLRLDSSVINDGRIAEYIHQARVKGKKATFELLIEGVKRGPKSKVTLKKVVYRIAGLISLISDIMRERLTEREIYELFKAVALDMGKEETDLLLTERPETFGRAILRERNFWMPTVKPDKK